MGVVKKAETMQEIAAVCLQSSRTGTLTCGRQQGMHTLPGAARGRRLGMRIVATSSKHLSGGLHGSHR